MLLIEGIIDEELLSVVQLLVKIWVFAVIFHGLDLRDGLFLRVLALEVAFEAPPK